MARASRSDFDVLGPGQSPLIGFVPESVSKVHASKGGGITFGQLDLLLRLHKRDPPDFLPGPFAEDRFRNRHQSTYLIQHTFPVAFSNAPFFTAGFLCRSPHFFGEQGWRIEPGINYPLSATILDMPYIVWGIGRCIVRDPTQRNDFGRQIEICIPMVRCMGVIGTMRLMQLPSPFSARLLALCILATSKASDLLLTSQSASL